ncbi:RadC family protein [Galbibacter sp.]|uniref:RadC family protein n=1 Tax=Galbibacter sp. TaxID=2918471 RepID=UPI002D0DF9D5|nr:DNA repair protein RadC [Galbibacter sp.]HLV63664.1 DNA repair protein RadC [Galbibacter sp.]
MKVNTPKISIRNWSADDRPREKMLLKGKDALSDAELIALLIGSGNRRESAVDLSKRILTTSRNSLSVLSRLSIEQLSKYSGIGKAKAIAIVAALELGRRKRLAKALPDHGLSNSEEVFEFMQPRIGELPHEEFWVIYLNNANRVVHTFQLSKGGITGTLVDVRLLIKEAVLVGAVSLILSHNHPSGTLRPSEADRNITGKIKIACDSMDIKVLDHLIITEKSYFSFKDEGIL